MGYQEDFTIEGKYGCHSGPNCKIAEICYEARKKLRENGKILEINIKKVFSRKNFSRRRNRCGRCDFVFSTIPNKRK